MKVALETRALEKTYFKGTPMEVQALKPTDLQIESGKFYAIIGRSGSGKSTLLHLLGALDTPTSGELIIGGERVYALRDAQRARLRRRRIGFVFQAYNLLAEHTADENIRMPLELDGRSVDEAHCAQIVRALGIEEKIHQYPNQLSGGEQQRVAIARALVTRPDILLADEPTGNLDPRTGDAVFALFRQTAAALSQTVILVTHDMDIARRADVVITLENGEIVSIDPIAPIVSGSTD